MPASATKKAATLEAHLRDFIADTLARCTRCGKCVEACPMPAYSASLQGADTRAVVAGVIDVLQSKPAAPESLEWLNVCTQSGRCSAACPEGINAMKMVRVGRIAALGALGGPVQLQARDDPVFFRRIGAFSQLQLTAEEIEQWQR